MKYKEKPTTNEKSIFGLFINECISWTVDDICAKLGHDWSEYEIRKCLKRLTEKKCIIMLFTTYEKNSKVYYLRHPDFNKWSSEYKRELVKGENNDLQNLS